MAPYTGGVKRASAWVFSLGLLGCGTPATPPASASAQQAPASTGISAETPTAKPVDEPEPQQSPPPPSPEPEPLPATADPVGGPGQSVPTVAGVLPPVPDPKVAVVVTLAKIQVGDVTVALEAGALPSAKSPPKAIVDAILASEHPVAWVVDAGVPAATLRTLIGALPEARARVLVMQTQKGLQGAVTLASTVPADAPLVRIAPDGFHIAKDSEDEEHKLRPDPAGDAFNYAALRGKAKSSRTQNPAVAGVRVSVEEGVTLEVLARAIAELRGPMCAAEPARCWLPDVAFGDGVKTSSGSPSTRKVELSKPAGTSGAPGTVKIGKAKVGEGVDASKVDAMLKRRLGFVRMCYFAGLAESPKLAGTVDLRLTLGKSGKVIEVGIPESSLDDDAVEACLTRGLSGLRFDPPKTAPVAVDVSLTFKLK